jgi:ribonuclease HI
MFFSDSESVLKGISNTSTKSSTLDITLILKDKLERLESRRKNQFFWIPRHCEVEVNKRAYSEAKQSIKECRDSQILLPLADLKGQWKKKGREELHSFCQNTERDGRKLR